MKKRSKSTQEENTEAEWQLIDLCNLNGSIKYWNKIVAIYICHGRIPREKA